MEPIENANHRDSFASHIRVLIINCAFMMSSLLNKKIDMNGRKGGKNSNLVYPMG